MMGNRGALTRRGAVEGRASELGEAARAMGIEDGEAQI